MDKQADKSTTDDQELANVLAEVNGSSVPVSTDEPDFIEPPVVASDDVVTTDATTDDVVPVDYTTPVVPEPVVASPALDPVAVAPVSPVVPSGAPVGELDAVKQQAIGELRPLVDKLNVSPEEKFDTYLLLIRSTDDRSLIAPAHLAAREIMDESRKAKALLDIIKEVDYLSNNQ